MRVPSVIQSDASNAAFRLSAKAARPDSIWRSSNIPAVPLPPPPPPESDPAEPSVSTLRWSKPLI